MPCKQCGGAIGIVEQEGATRRGQFREAYKCVNCGATGEITGEASDHPTDWNYYGSVFK